MKDVAADRHREPLDATEIAADGQRVEQRLGRMLVRAVAGVDDRAVDLAREQMHRARVSDGAPRECRDAWRSASSRYRSASRPFSLEPPTAMFMTSAPSRFPASSNDDWVRVEASKKRLIWVRPRKVARFFSTCREMVTASSERSSSASISGATEALDAEQVALGEDGRRGHREARV